MIPCPRERVEKVLDVRQIDMFYGGLVCLDKPEKMSFRRNWNEKTYKMHSIMMVKCRNKTIDGEDCASDEEISQFFQTYDFVSFIGNKFVEPDIFADSPQVQNHPYYGDPDKYFPI